MSTLDGDDTALAPLRRRLRVSYRSIVLVIIVVAAGLALRTVVARSIGVIEWAARSAVVAGLLYPLTRVLARKMPRPLAALATLFIVAVVVGSTGALVVGDLRTENARVQRVLPEAARKVEASSRFGRAATDFELSRRVEEFVNTLPGKLAGGTGAAAVRRTASRGATLLVNIVLTIFLLLYGPRLLAGAFALVSDPRRRLRVEEIAAHAYRRAWRYATGRLGLSALAAIFASSLCRFADLPGATVLGLVVGLLSLIPYVGVLVGGLPMVLLAFGLRPGSWGLFVLLALGVYQAVESVVGMRRLHRRSISFGPALSTLVAMVFFELGGVGLALVGIAVAVLAACIADELRPA